MTTGLSAIPQNIPTTNRRVLSEAEMKAMAEREFKRIQDEDEQSADDSENEDFVTASEHEDEPAIFDYDSVADKKSAEPQAKYQPGAFGAFGILGNYGVTPLSNPIFLSNTFAHLPRNADKNAVEDDQSQSASDVEDGDVSGNEEALEPGNITDNFGPASLTRTVFDSIFGHHTPVVEHQVSDDEVIASENEEESDNESDSEDSILSYLKELFPEAQQEITEESDDQTSSDEENYKDVSDGVGLIDDNIPVEPAETTIGQDDIDVNETGKQDSVQESDEEDTHEDNVQVDNAQDDSLQEESEKDDSVNTPGVPGEPQVELKDSFEEDIEQDNIVHENTEQGNTVQEDTEQEDTDQKDSVLDDIEFEKHQSDDDDLIASLSDSSNSHLQTKSEIFYRPLLNNVRRRKPTIKGWTDPASHGEPSINSAMPKPKLDSDVDNGTLKEEDCIAEVADDKQESDDYFESAETETAEKDSSLDNKDSEAVESKDDAPIIDTKKGGKCAKKRKNRKKKSGKKKTDEKNSVVLESDEDVEDAEGSKELDDPIDSVDDHSKHPDFPVITPLGSDDGSRSSTTLIDFDKEEQETDQTEELGKRLSTSFKMGKLGDVGLLHNVLLAQNVLGLNVPKIDVKAAADDDPIIDVDVKDKESLGISNIEDSEKEQNIQSDPNPPAAVSESEEEVTSFTQTETDNAEDIGTSNAEKLTSMIRASLAKPIRKSFHKPTVKRWTDPVYDVIVDDDPKTELIPDNEPGIQNIEDHEYHSENDTTLDDGETDSDKDEESSNKEEEDDVLQTLQEESESEGNDEDSEHEKLDHEKDQTNSQEESEQSLTIEPSEGKRQSVRAPSRSKWEGQVDDGSFKGTITSAVVDDSIESSNSADDEGSRKDDESIIEDSDPDISRSEIEKEDEEVEKNDESEFVKADLIDSHLATSKTTKKEDLREPSLSTEKEFEANSEEKKVPLTINEEKKDPLFVPTGKTANQPTASIAFKVPEPGVNTNASVQSNGTSDSTVLLETPKKSSWNYALIGSVAGLAVLSVAGYFGFRHNHQIQEESVEL